MLKRIPKSDISIRPFKAYKEWSFSSGSTQIDLLEADSTSTDLSGLYPKNSIHGNIKSIFYNGQDDNLINRVGLKTNTYTIFTNAKERNLESYAKVISIPNIYIGEGIKRNSVTIDDSGSLYTDDGFGNLRGGDLLLSLDTIDFNGSFITYFNLENIINEVNSLIIEQTQQIVQAPQDELTILTTSPFLKDKGTLEALCRSNNGTSKPVNVNGKYI